MLRNPKNHPCYVSDIFSMVGTLFLLCYWPSFNGALAGVAAADQVRKSGGATEAPPSFKAQEAYFIALLGAAPKIVRTSVGL